MFIREPIYDLYTLSRCNLHIHSVFSSCAKPEMDIPSVVERAHKSNIDIIAVTDHYNSVDCSILDTNEKLKYRMKNVDTPVRVLYGAELSAFGVGKYLDTSEVNQNLDYRLYSYNHYHLNFWEQPEEKSPRGYVDHALAILTHLLKSGRADCIAHPFIGRFIRCFEDRCLVTREITDNELGDILELGSHNQVAWEINVNAIISDPEFARRYWNIGREAGILFNMGTDAHTLAAIDTMQYLPKLMEILEGK